MEQRKTPSYTIQYNLNLRDHTMICILRYCLPLTSHVLITELSLENRHKYLTQVKLTWLQRLKLQG